MVAPILYGRLYFDLQKIGNAPVGDDDIYAHGLDPVPGDVRVRPVAGPCRYGGRAYGPVAKGSR